MLVVFMSLFFSKTLPVDGKGYEAAKGLRIFAVTIQGLVFFLIFFFIKVQNVRWSNTDKTVWEAMKRVFRDPPDDVVLLNLEAMTSPSQRYGDHAKSDPSESGAASAFRSSSGVEMNYDGRSSIEKSAN
jgi:hypothetical protein